MILLVLPLQAKAAEKDGTGGIIHINIDKSSFGKALRHRSLLCLLTDCGTDDSVMTERLRG